MKVMNDTDVCASKEQKKGKIKRCKDIQKHYHSRIRWERARATLADAKRVENLSDPACGDPSTAKSDGIRKANRRQQ